MMSQENARFDDLDATDMYFSVIAARYNGDLMEALIKRVLDTLMEQGASRQNIDVARVPGSNELPYLAAMHGLSRRFDCVIALGVVIAGATPHHEIIAHSTANALHTVGLTTETPVINGIIVVNSLEQAEERVIGSFDRGAEFAKAAIEMASHKIAMVEALDEIEGADIFDEGGDDDLKQLFRKN